jgi:hypothetical protein
VVPSAAKNGKTWLSKREPSTWGTEDFPRLDVETLAGHPHATVFHALLHCRDKGDLPLLQQALTNVNTLPRKGSKPATRTLKRKAPDSTDRELFELRGGLPAQSEAPDANS